MDGAAMEPGIVTLAKIVGLLACAISIIPLVFVFSAGKRDEPTDNLAGPEWRHSAASVQSARAPLRALR